VDPDGLLLQRPDALMVGCLLALVRWKWPDALGTLVRPVQVGAVSLAALLLLVAADARWLNEGTYVHGLFLGVSVATAFLIGHLVSQPSVPAERASMISRILSVRPFTQIGRISYGLYLWHYPIFVYVDLRTSLTGVAAEFVKVALAFVFAVTSWFLIERPALRLKRRFAAPLVPLVT